MIVTDGLFTPNSIMTESGLFFNYLEMEEDTIIIEDIAHALSLIPRWMGHTPGLYSVAQHSCWCCDKVTKDSVKLQALMHDASEAYMGDVPSPLKALLPNYQRLEDLLQKKIAYKFNFDYPYDPDVKTTDRSALVYEWGSFKVDGSMFQGFDFWNPAKAKREFLKRFNKLKKS
jgi:hypothetical protein